MKTIGIKYVEKEKNNKPDNVNKEGTYQKLFDENNKQDLVNKIQQIKEDNNWRTENYIILSVNKEVIISHEKHKEQQIKSLIEEDI